MEPCPFCGYKSDDYEVFGEREGGHGGGIRGYYVSCSVCYSRGPVADVAEYEGDVEATRRTAILMWRTRRK